MMKFSALKSLAVSTLCGAVLATSVATGNAVEPPAKRLFGAQRVAAALPAAVQASVFDMYVNAGANAVTILQRLLNDMGQTVVVDGAIGPKTIAATEGAMALAPSHFVDAYGIARRNYYFALADGKPTLRKFARTRAGGKGGWITRAEEFISERYHLTATEFQERIATWA